MSDENGNGKKPRIGFIGTGHIGTPMAFKLLEAGYQVVVFNRTEDRARSLEAKGAVIAESPRHLAAKAEIIMSAVSDDDAVRAVYYGPRGVLAGARPDSTIIEFSTIYPDTSRCLWEAAREKGVHCLDAKISGSVQEAKRGELVVMVGGNRDVFERRKPVLDAMCKAAFYVGPAGSAATMKLVINTILAVGMQAVAEALALGEKAGLPREEVVDVLSKTYVIGPAHIGKLDNALTGEYPVAFSVALMRKDMGLMLRMAAELGVPMPATAICEQMVTAEKAKGLDEDYSAVMKLMEELSSTQAVQRVARSAAAVEKEASEDIIT
jgi:3-hydroxyisobutyrate dehydrogenase-like beta-hydroxyacid dehydrogenase